MGELRGAPHREGVWRWAACCPLADMDQDYKRRLLRQINHQNLPAEKEVSLLCSSTPSSTTCWSHMMITHDELCCFMMNCAVSGCSLLPGGQCEVRGSLHSHPSWKQLERQLPLQQRESSGELLCAGDAVGESSPELHSSSVSLFRSSSAFCFCQQSTSSHRRASIRSGFTNPITLTSQKLIVTGGDGWLITSVVSGFIRHARPNGRAELLKLNKYHTLKP